MKKILLSISVLFFVFSFSFAQNGIGNSFLFQASGAGLRVADLPVKQGETLGTYYIDEEWNNANIKLTTDEIAENYMVKVNVKDKFVEIQTEDEIKLLEFTKINYMEWENNGVIESFIYAKSYMNNDELGFAQMYYDGEVKLFSKPMLVLLPSNYNEALNAGTNSDKYVIEQKLFVYKDENLISIKNNKSSVIKALSDKETEIKTYIKENKLKCKSTEDLTAVVKYYDELF